jgi:uncharacterized protein (TIGR00369 family)
MTSDSNNPLAGSQFIEDLGVKLIDWQDGRACIELEIVKRLSNRLGMAHGGVISTLLDQVMGLAWRSIGQDRVPGGTINLNVNFIAPGNGMLKANGRLIRFTKSSAFCEGDVTDSSGSIIASAQGVFSARLSTKATVQN